MSPLEPFKDDILIPSNIWTPLGNGHVSGPPTWLTGQDYQSRAVNAGGVSVDQIVANHLSDETLLPSLELSLQGRATSRTRCRATPSPGRRPIAR